MPRIFFTQNPATLGVRKGEQAERLSRHGVRDGCEAIEGRGRSRRARPIREAAFASLTHLQQFDLPSD
jgi:hypothetical protein